MKIECLDNWVSSLSGITRRGIAVNHTLYSYWAVTYPENFRANMDAVINGGAPVIETNNLGSLRSRRSWPKYLKYCPLCVAEDKVVYGETYWHRQHQLAEMLYCVKHQVRLANSEVSVRMAGTGFYPASVMAVTESNYDCDELAPFKDKLLRIARESEWLIVHGLDVEWSDNGHEKYWKLLRDKGLASFQGRCDYPALESAFIDYWGEDFIKSLFTETGDMRFRGWTHQMDKNKIRSYVPLYHILLMCFLAENVSGFVSSCPADTPYGHPPFECENPICPHYHVNGAEMVSLRYYGTGVTAVFECSDCGLQYRQNKAKYSRELRVVTNYGQLWMDEFRRCCQDKGITNEQMSSLFRIDRTTLLALKKKQGLSRPYNYDLQLGAKDYYRHRVAELSAEGSEVTIALLQEKIPGAYDYLKRFDKEWISSRIVFVNNLSSVREYEDAILCKLNDVIAKFADAGYPKRQVTYGYIAALVGTTRDKLRSRERFRSLLDDVVERQSDWVRRRTNEICTERIASAKATTLKTIRREMGLHTGTYEQYQALLQEVIDTIYGK
jgi:hypothetical protein